MFSKVRKNFFYYERAVKLEERMRREHEELVFLREEMRKFANDAAIGRMVKGILHDFKNLITMLGEQDLIRIALKNIENGITPEQKKILKSSLQILRDVCCQADETFPLCAMWAQSILDSCQLGGGKKLQSILPFINSALLICKGELGHKGIETVINAEDDIPPILCNKGDMMRLLLNLIINAMQSMENVENQKIIFSLQYNKGEVYLGVEDTGKSIPPEILQHIFKKEFTTKEGGMGFGLSIVQEIVNNHGGKITVRNLQQGKVFLLTFPCLT